MPEITASFCEPWAWFNQEFACGSSLFTTTTTTTTTTIATPPLPLRLPIFPEANHDHDQHLPRHPAALSCHRRAPATSEFDAAHTTIRGERNGDTNGNRDATRRGQGLGDEGWRRRRRRGGRAVDEEAGEARWWTRNTSRGRAVDEEDEAWVKRVSGGTHHHPVGGDLATASSGGRGRTYGRGGGADGGGRRRDEWVTDGCQAMGVNNATGVRAWWPAGWSQREVRELGGETAQTGGRGDKHHGASGRKGRRRDQAMVPGLAVAGS
ncbi:hypothetical protein CPC08DRAFT_729668 [Agrocybe pediades]|nr:hypothetical protein CPC08DRAFT_729668 [Agrocybe pediades]